MSKWRTNRSTRKPYKTVLGRSISDLAENSQYSETVVTGMVSDLNDDKSVREWSFVDDSTEVEIMMKLLNISPDEGFGAFFVRNSATNSGDITPEDVYFIKGSVPELYKQIYQVSELR